MPITPTKFFFNPFAVAGDKTAIPNDTQPSGSISYSQGWGPDYALNYPSDPAAIPVDRAATNQLNYDITNALKQYEIQGVPNFISISDNDNAGPFSYDIYAFCLYDDGINGQRVFQSLMNGNTNIPSLQSTLQNFTVSGNNLIISSSTGYYTGAAVTVKTTGTLPTPLVAGTTYYVINVNSTTIQLATTLANALSNVPITLSGAPSGTNTVVIPITWRWMDFSANKITIESATFQGSVSQGNIVYWDAVNNWYAQAKADGSSAQNVIGIADVTNSRVYVAGLVSILTGLTPGDKYYLSTTTPGAITITKPFYNNAVLIGVAQTVNTLFLNPVPVQGASTVAKVYLSTFVTLPSGNVSILVPWDIVVYDPASLWDSADSAFLIQEAGYYDISARIFMSGIPTASLYIEIWINGVQYERLNEVPSDNFNVVVLGNSKIYLNSGDKVTIRAINNSSTNTTMGGGLVNSSFEISYFGP